MTVWLVEPRDTILVRDGRSFSSDPGARAASVDFPLPSTTTGGARTRLGMDPRGVFDASRIDELLTRSFRGPFLVELSSSGAVAQWLVPAPADALLFEDAAGGALKIRGLAPLEAPAGARTDLDAVGLSLVGPTRPDPSKPAKNAPAFWYWSRLARWLERPADEDGLAVGDIGTARPERETRTHVSIAANQEGGSTASTGTALEGALFQTEGLRFCIPGGEDARLAARRTALAVAMDDARGMTRCLAALGGERRLVAWRDAGWSLPGLPAAVRDRIVKDRALRIVLATPALFEQGWRPRRILDDARLGLSVDAVALGRPQVLSGWDLKCRAPKPSRRMVPAGSVYFCRITGQGSDQDVRSWLEASWLKAISDGDHDCRDGFGVALFGTWSGKKAELSNERSR